MLAGHGQVKGGEGHVLESVLGARVGWGRYGVRIKSPGSPLQFDRGGKTITYLLVLCYILCYLLLLDARLGYEQARKLFIYFF